MPRKRSAKKVGVKPKAKRLLGAKPKGSLRADVAPANFRAVFERLKKVMSEFEPELRATADESRKYYVVTKSKSWKGGPMFFGAVVAGKAYVSYHLFPLYACPEMVRMVSSNLKERMQGKSCFNFRTLDEALFAELSGLTKAGVEKYRAKNWL